MRQLEIYNETPVGNETVTDGDIEETKENDTIEVDGDNLDGDTELDGKFLLISDDEIMKLKVNEFWTELKSVDYPSRV